MTDKMESVAERRGHYQRLEKAYCKEINADPEQFYDAWARTYETEVFRDGYRGPETLSPFLLKYMSRDDSVCDLGAGTGLIGMHMRNLGFTNITAFDASAKMLAIAKSRNIYDHYVHALLEPDKPPVAGPFDAIVGSGIIGPRHLNPSHFPAIAALLKPRGKGIFSINERWMRGREPDLDWCFDMRTELKRLEGQGIFQVVEITTLPDVYRAIVVLERL